LPFDRFAAPSPNPRLSPIRNVDFRVDFSFGKHNSCYRTFKAVTAFPERDGARGWLFEPIRRLKIWTMMIFDLEL